MCLVLYIIYVQKQVKENFRYVFDFSVTLHYTTLHYTTLHYTKPKSLA
jgi:hypothetical protein